MSEPRTLTVDVPGAFLRYDTEQHADDLHRLISALVSAPVEIFGSGGGAVVGLAPVSRHPEQVRTPKGEPEAFAVELREVLAGS